MLDAALACLDAALRDVILVRRLTLLDVAEHRIARRRQRAGDPGRSDDRVLPRCRWRLSTFTVRKPVVPRAVPDGDDRDVDALQVLDQPRLVAHVADDHDRVALSRLEHGCEVPAPRRHARARGRARRCTLAVARLERERVDRACEERVGDVPRRSLRAASLAHRAARAACGFGRYESSGRRERHALARLRWRWERAAACRSGFRETVLCATPAALAMSFIVAGRFRVRLVFAAARLMTADSWANGTHCCPALTSRARSGIRLHCIRLHSTDGCCIQNDARAQSHLADRGQTHRSRRQALHHRVKRRSRFVKRDDEVVPQELEGIDRAALIAGSR